MNWVRKKLDRIRLLSKFSLLCSKKPNEESLIILITSLRRPKPSRTDWILKSAAKEEISCNNFSNIVKLDFTVCELGALAGLVLLSCRLCHIKMSLLWKILPVKDNQGFDVSPLLKYRRPHKKSPHYKITSPKSLPRPTIRQFTGKNLSRPGGRRAGRIFTGNMSAGGKLWGDPIMEHRVQKTRPSIINLVEFNYLRALPRLSDWGWHDWRMANWRRPSWTGPVRAGVHVVSLRASWNAGRWWHDSTVAPHCRV